MASTYSLNNGFELIGDGEQTGTWGQTTNTNWELLDEALEGQVTITLPAAGSSGSPNTLAISDGASSDGRHKFVEFNDGGDLGATAYVQLTPNDAEKIMYVRNSLSASRSIILFQGTYSTSNDYELASGQTAVLKFDGGGAGATVTNVFSDLDATSSNVTITGGTITGITDLAVADGGTGASTAADARTNLGLVIGTDVQAWDAELDGLAGIGTNGMLARTGAGTAASRTITAGTDITVTNGDGVSGNPTVAHGDTSTLSGTYGSTVDGTKIDTITVDANGHVTAVATGNTGDILGVTAGTNLNGGGTSGTVTLNLDSTISITELNIGAGVELRESADRADLLQIRSLTGSWGGLQIYNATDGGRWSFMTDATNAGIYDDANSDWAIRMYENAQVELNYNGAEKLTTTSVGVSVTGTMNATSQVQEGGSRVYSPRNPPPGPSTSVNAVGTYAMMHCPTNTTPGSTISGSNLEFTNGDGYIDTAQLKPVGTWRSMGYCTEDTYGRNATVCVRIS